MKRLFVFAAAMVAACATPEIPKPDFKTMEPPPEPVVETSVIQIPVTVYLGPVIEKAEATVPMEVESKGWEVVGTSPVGDLGVQYRLWREPLQVFMKDRKITVSVHAYYWLMVAHRLKPGLLSKGEQPWMPFGSCGQAGEAPREIVLTTETEVSWTGEWKIYSFTKALPNYYPVPCNITALEVNITGTVDAAVRPKLAEVGKMIDARIAQQADFHEKAREMWSKIQSPAELEKGVWLLPNMESINVTPITGAGRQIETSLEMRARPALTTGQKPAVAEKPLPKLKEIKKGEGDFRLILKGELGFDAAADRLLKRLAANPVKMGNQALDVAAVNIYPSGRQCVIQLVLKGDIKGTVYLAGEPVYEEDTGTLYFKDLNFTLETENFLHRAAEWLAHDDLLKKIRSQARFKLNTELENARGGIQKALNAPLDEHASLHGSLKELQLKSLYMGPRAFHVTLGARGSAEVIWK